MILSAETRRTLLPDYTGSVVLDSVRLGGRTFELLRPEKPEALLDDPSVIAAFERDEYMPYWADLWPCASMLAEEVLRHEWPAGAEALEVGCGLGLVGVAALAKGLKVTFSDYEPLALHFAAANARLNGFNDFRQLYLDWRRPPDLSFPILFAADVLYERRNVQPVARLIERVLCPNGIALVADQDRSPAETFVSWLPQTGLRFESFATTWRIAERIASGTIFRIAKVSENEPHLAAGPGFRLP